MILKICLQAIQPVGKGLYHRGMLHAKCYRHLLVSWNVAAAMRYSYPSRSFLSDAYACHSEFDERLKSEVLTDVKIDELYRGLVAQLSAENKASAVDVDVLANSVSKPNHLDMLEEIIYRFRHSYNNWDILESTHQAVLRAYLKHKNTDTILHIVENRIDYGIFLDHHMANILMNYFIKSNDYRGASRIAIAMMFQEELDHPITKLLALYSCHMDLQHPQSDVEEGEDEDNVQSLEDDEQEWVIKYQMLTNPYFDDHFDIKDHEKLIGKTLISCGRLFPNTIGRSSMLIGFALYSKFSEGIEFLQQFVDNDNSEVKDDTVSICRCAVDRFESQLESAPVEDPSLKYISSLKWTPSYVNTDMGDEKLEQLTNARNREKLNFKKVKEELLSKGVICDDDLNLLITEYVTSDKLSPYELVDIEAAKERFAKWIVVREEKVKEQIHEYLKAERIRMHDQARKEIEEKEEMLTYFDKKLEYEKFLPTLPTLESLKNKYKGKLDEIYDNYESLVREEEWMEKHGTLQKVGDPKTSGPI